MIFFPHDEADVKNWFIQFMKEYQTIGFDYSKWIYIQRHAYADYPCRELSEKIILKSFNHIVNVVTNYKEVANSYIIYSLDKDVLTPDQNEELEIIINFSKTGKGTIISAWRENSPSHKKCCCEKGKLKANKNPCKYLINTRKI